MLPFSILPFYSLVWSFELEGEEEIKFPSSPSPARGEGRGEEGSKEGIKGS